MNVVTLNNSLKHYEQFNRFHIAMTNDRKNLDDCSLPRYCIICYKTNEYFTCSIFKNNKNGWNKNGWLCEIFKKLGVNI